MPVGKSSIARAVTAKNAPAKKPAKTQAEEAKEVEAVAPAEETAVLTAPVAEQAAAPAEEVTFAEVAAKEPVAAPAEETAVQPAPAAGQTAPAAKPEKASAKGRPAAKKPAGKKSTVKTAAKKSAKGSAAERKEVKAEPAAVAEAAPKRKPGRPRKVVTAHVIGQISEETLDKCRHGEESYGIGQELPRYLL